MNHLATALLSILLLPNMARAAREHKELARLVLVASEVTGLIGLGSIARHSLEVRVALWSLARD